MTAKELIWHLQEILEQRKGRDYVVLVWTGVGKTHGIEFLQLEENDDNPEVDHISLQTLRLGVERAWSALVLRCEPLLAKGKYLQMGR